MRKVVYFDSSEFESKSSIEHFSLVQDLRTAKFPIKRKYRALITEYSKYVSTKKSTLEKETIDEIDKLLVSKFNVLINEVEKEIEAGRSLDMLLGITEAKLKAHCVKFSRIYKRMLLQREKLGYIPKDMQSRVDDAYKLMIAELRNLVFKPVVGLFSILPGDLPREADPSQTTMLENRNPTLEQLREYILGIYKNDNLTFTIDNNKLIIEINEENTNQIDAQ